MSDHVQQLFAERIGGAQFGLKEEIYKFEKIKRAKRAALEANPQVELIDMGVGEPDEMADIAIVARLAAEAGKKENRFYADNGIQAFKEAAQNYMAQVFGVENLHADTDINHVIGSKSALAMLPSVFINPGDLTLMTSPGYPVLGTHTKYLGGEVYHLPLIAENAFLPRLDQIPADVLQRAKLLYLNYPNNPTGAVATEAFFREVVAFAKQHELVVIHDAAYAALTFDGVKPLSFLSIPGAKDVGIELHSLSKSFNMTGWRIGFIAGNTKIVKAFATIKDNHDSGQFIPIQKAACYALAHPEITAGIAEKYSRRHNMLKEALSACGFPAHKPQGSFFQYVKTPTAVADGPSFGSAEDFCQYLIRQHSISSVPWDDSGAYIRFSVTFQADSVEEERRVIAEIQRRLSRDKYVFGGEAQ